MHKTAVIAGLSLLLSSPAAMASNSNSSQAAAHANNVHSQAAQNGNAKANGQDNGANPGQGQGQDKDQNPVQDQNTLQPQMSPAQSSTQAAQSNVQPADHKNDICHATGSSSNPFVDINVDKHANNAHDNHQNDEDVIGSTTASGCPASVTPVTPGTPGTPGNPGTPGRGGGVVLAATAAVPTISPVEMDTVSKLPETGANSMALIVATLAAIASLTWSYRRQLMQAIA